MTRPPPRLAPKGLFNNRDPRMDDRQTAELFDRLRAGDLSARDRIVAGHLKIVAYLLYVRRRGIRRSGVDKYDLFQDGVLALMRAVDLWSPGEGRPFLPYAFKAASRGIANAIDRHESRIRVEQLAGRLRPRRAEVWPDHGDEEQRAADAARIRRLLDRLPDRQARLVRLRYGLDGGEPMTLDQLGRMIGVTKERVRQILGRGESTLRGMPELAAD